MRETHTISSKRLNHLNQGDGVYMFRWPNQNLLKRRKPHSMRKCETRTTAYEVVSLSHWSCLLIRRLAPTCITITSISVSKKTCSTANFPLVLPDQTPSESWPSWHSLPVFHEASLFGIVIQLFLNRSQKVVKLIAPQTEAGKGYTKLKETYTGWLSGKYINGRGC